jgi:hypothetical protein
VLAVPYNELAALARYADPDDPKLDPVAVADGEWFGAAGGAAALAAARGGDVAGHRMSVVPRRDRADVIAVPEFYVRRQRSAFRMRAAEIACCLL